MTEALWRSHNHPASWKPDSLPWGDEHPDGTKYVLLEGNRQLVGVPFTYAFFLPTGFWDPPHRHTQDARIVVVQGVLRLNYSSALQPANAVEYPLGSLIYVPAHAIHFDGATEDTTIIGVAQGDWKTEYLDPSQRGSAGTLNRNPDQ